MQTDSVIEWRGDENGVMWISDPDACSGVYANIINVEDSVAPVIRITVEIEYKTVLEAKVRAGNMDLARAIAEAAIRHELGKWAKDE